MVGSLPSIALAGDKVDMANVTCQQFLADQDGLLPTLFWIDGYLSHASGNTEIDPDQLVQNAKDIAASCQSEPDKKVMDLLEQ